MQGGVSGVLAARGGGNSPDGAAGSRRGTLSRPGMGSEGRVSVQAGSPRGSGEVPAVPHMQPARSVFPPSAPCPHAASRDTLDSGLVLQPDLVSP